VRDVEVEVIRDEVVVREYGVMLTFDAWDGKRFFTRWRR
jgi:hypothetical protein